MRTRDLRLSKVKITVCVRKGFTTPSCLRRKVRNVWLCRCLCSYPIVHVALTAVSHSYILELFSSLLFFQKCDGKKTDPPTFSSAFCPWPCLLMSMAASIFWQVCQWETWNVLTKKKKKIAILRSFVWSSARPGIAAALNVKEAVEQTQTNVALKVIHRQDCQGFKCVKHWLGA